MPEFSIPIPDRPAFKAAEVCEIAQIPPYVLRSWEKEFPGLGVAARPGGAKVYRRADVEQVLRIKHLLFAEGLTLAGARRKLEGEPPPEAEAEGALPVPDEVRAKVAGVKRELRSLLDLLSASKIGGEGRPEGDAAGGEPAAARAAGAGPGPARPSPETGTPPVPVPAHANEGSTWPPARPAAHAGRFDSRTPGKPAGDGEALDPGLPLGEAAEGPAPPRPRRRARPAKG